jgi:ferrochelatase
MSTNGILLVNLGSPDSPSVRDVRRYLREFLMDGRVLDVPYLLRFALVNFAILPRRPKESAEAYHKIWTQDGSPLVFTSRKVQAELQRRLNMPVELAMRYQNPSILEAVRKLQSRGVKELLLFPMFPHYAMSSYETAVVGVQEVLAHVAPEISLRVVPPYYDDEGYINALVGSATPFLQHAYDHLLFSFHGVPERHIHKADPSGHHPGLTGKNCCDPSNPAHKTCYRAHCLATAKAFVKRAGVKEHSVAFQSRLGKDPWLRPYSDKVIEDLAQRGVKKLAVICPSFVCDCLETLEEMGIRGRQTFLEAGGKEFALIPCLNDHPLWLSALENIVRGYSKKTDAPQKMSSVGQNRLSRNSDRYVVSSR